MKAFIKILFFCLLSVGAFSQTVIQRGQPTNTQKDDRLIVGRNFYGPRYADTTAANLDRGVDSLGAQIYTYDVHGYWYRSASPRRWVRFVSSSSGSGTDTDTNNYPTSLVFDSTGTLILGRSGLSDLSTIIDGRYIKITDTAGRWVDTINHKLVMPSGFTVSGSPITSGVGTFTVTGGGTTAQYMDGTGALQTLAINVGDSAGSTQFSLTQNSQLRFDAGDGIDISYDAATKRVIIGNTGISGGGDGNNYTNSLSYDSTTRILTLGRQGLGNLTTTFNNYRWYVDSVVGNSNAHVHGVANSAGTQQFTVGINENIRFVGAGATSVTFNAGTKLVTITSTDTDTDTDTNNFPSSLSFSTSTGDLTLGRTGLSALTANLDGRYLTSNAHNHIIANSAGTQQFTVGVNESLRFEGTGGTTVSFDAGTKKVTINSSGGSSSDWTLAGNAIAGGTDFFGTTNNTSIEIRTNNVARWYILNSGSLIPAGSGIYSVGSSVANASNVYSSAITSPLIIGGESSSSAITYKPTTASGTTSSNSAHIFLGGNNGATSIMTYYNSGQMRIHQQPTGSASTYRIITRNTSGDVESVPSMTLTTTGTSGAATYNSLTNTLNIPQYSGGGGSSSIDSTTVSNLGAGTGIYAQEVANDIQLKSFVAGSNVSISNNATTITISATDTDTDTNNYPTSLTFDSTTQRLTLARNGLSSLVVKIPSEGTTPSQTRNWEQVMMAGNWTTRDAYILSRGLDTTSKFVFAKTSDSIAMEVTENTGGTFLFDMAIGNHPDNASNLMRYDWRDSKGNNSNWNPYRFGNVQNTLSGSKTNWWSRLYIPTQTSFNSVNGGSFTSTTYNVTKEAGIGSGNFFIDGTAYTDTVSRMYWVKTIVDSNTTATSAVDVVFVIDTTGSMGGVITSIQSSVNSLASYIASRSGNDYRLGIVTFGDSVVKRLNFSSNNYTAFEAVVNALDAPASSGGNIPEASNAAVDTAVYFSWRPGVGKIVILITDAAPGAACTNDVFDYTCDLQYNDAISVRARADSIKVSSIFTSVDYQQGYYNGSSFQGIWVSSTVKRWADSTGGIYYHDPNGNNFLSIATDIIDTFATTTTTYGDVVTVFDWGYGNGSNRVTVGTDVAITGGWQALEKGIQVKLTGTTKAGDEWTWRTYPTALPELHEDSQFVFLVRDDLSGQIKRLPDEIFGVADSTGARKIDMRYGDDLRFVGRGVVNVTWDSLTQKVIITGTAGSGADGNNYTSGGSYASATGVLTLTRVDLPDITISGFPTSGNFIQNQTTLQSSSNFNISGNGKANTFSIRDDSGGGVATLNYANSGNATFTFPTAGGTVPISVNSQLANSGGNISLSTTNVPEGTNLYFTDERVDDRVGALLVAGSNITLNYNDAANTLTISSSGGGGGGLTSVGLSMPSGFTVSNSPLTSNGTIAVTTTLNGLLRGDGSGITTTTIGDRLSFSGGTLSADNQLHGIANSGGTQQFTFGNGEDFKVTASGIASITFPGSKTVNVHVPSEADAIALAKTITINEGLGIDITGSATQPLSGNPSFTVAIDPTEVAGSFILNQFAAQQSSSNYWISGTGRMGSAVIDANTTIGGLLTVGTSGSYDAVSVLGKINVSDLINAAVQDVNTGGGGTDAIRLNLRHATSGSANIMMQGTILGGGNSTSPTIYFGDSYKAWGAVRGIYTGQNGGGTAALGDVAILNTPDVSTTALAVNTRFTKEGTVKITSLDTDATAPTTSGTTKMVITDANGQLSFTDFSGLTLAAIGSSPNANGMTISSAVLNLEPASVNFGGVVTTGTQTFAGFKEFTGGVRLINDLPNLYMGQSGGTGAFVPTIYWYPSGGGASSYYTASVQNSDASFILNNGSGSTKLILAQGGNLSLASLDTDVTAPTTSGTTKIVITDANGQLSFENRGTVNMVVIEDASYTIAAGVTDVHYGSLTADRTVTLPSAASSTNRKITIHAPGEDSGGATHQVLFSTNVWAGSASTSDQISGLGGGLFEWVTIVSDGTKWRVVAQGAGSL